MDLDMGAVQRNDIDLNSEYLSPLQFCEHSIQNATLGPPIHSRVDGVPVPESGRQASPLTPVFGHEKDRVEQVEVFHADIATLLRQAMLDESELVF
jgi:hypothetical protein